MSDWIQTVNTFVLQHILPSVLANPMPLFVVLTFVAMNLALYGFTRGREFLFNSLAAALFMIPLIRFA